MSIWRLAWKEILHRKINFLSGLISVIISIAVLAGVLITLRVLDFHTEQILAQKEKETSARMVLLQDDYRKIMKILGFNLLIIPENQKLADFYEEDLVSTYMPESYAEKLANAKLVTIQHILPNLQQKIKWPEKKRTIILIGTRGEMTEDTDNRREPLLLAVPRDHAVIGFELAESLQLAPQERIVLMGRTFTILKCNEERGTRDDISIWIDLGQAQELLQKPKKINAILALKCHCFGNDIETVRRDIADILPGVQVIEQGSKVITRAEARDRAKQEAEKAMAAEIANRQKVRQEMEQFSSRLTPSVLLISAIWLALTFFVNARDRKSEVGLLRACGASSWKIIKLFLIKAVLLGLVGAVIGYFLGAGIALSWQSAGVASLLFNPVFFLLALCTAIVLSIFASWMPALYAARQDPALVLAEE